MSPVNCNSLAASSQQPATCGSNGYHPLCLRCLICWTIQYQSMKGSIGGLETSSLLCTFCHDKNFGRAFAALLMTGLSPIDYNTYFHPLRRFPGPWMMAASRWWKRTRGFIKRPIWRDCSLTLMKKYGNIEKWMSMVSPDAFCRLDCAD